MAAKKAKPKNITEYIAAVHKEAQKKLREMQACIRAAAPGDDTLEIEPPRRQQAIARRCKNGRCKSTAHI